MIYIRSKFRLIFESYFDFAQSELTTGTDVSYMLNQNYCRFSVTFHKAEFVFVEKFYEHLKECFEKMETEDNWSDFTQSYDEKKGLHKYNLVSVCFELNNIGINVGSRKKNIFL